MPMPGYEQYGDGWLIVFNYDPAGNYIGQYGENVMPPKSVDNCGANVPDPCEEDPCKNNGVCNSDVSTNSRTCTCASGYEGDSCQSKFKLLSVF